MFSNTNGKPVVRDILESVWVNYGRKKKGETTFTFKSPYDIYSISFPLPCHRSKVT